jgi:hypothetical protein
MSRIFVVAFTFEGTNATTVSGYANDDEGACAVPRNVAVIEVAAGTSALHLHCW